MTNLSKIKYQLWQIHSNFAENMTLYFILISQIETLVALFTKRNVCPVTVDSSFSLSRFY